MKTITEVPVLQDIIVDVVESHLEVAYANQYDDNTSTIQCHIQNRGVDFNVENYTATLRVKKSNGKGFSANIGSTELEGAVHGNVISFKIPRYLTVSHGKQICNLEFFEKDHVENGMKYSCTFYLRVNKSALQEEDILDSDYYASVHDEYIKLKTDMTDALTAEQERATQAENTMSDNLATHTAARDNPHAVTKSQLGLGNVEDKSSASIREEITKENVTNALGYTPYTPNEVDNKLSALETNKVDKIDGKGLSTNDFTNDYKSTLDNISGGTVTGIKGSAESDYRTGNVNLTKDNIGLGNVGNFKAVSTSASQGLSSTEKSNARANIEAQSSLGFTPVQQGGGSGQSTNKIYIGWSGSQLKAQVDATDMGAIVTTSGNNSTTLPVSKGGTGATSAATARSNLGITPANIGALSTTGGTMTGNILGDIYIGTGDGHYIKGVCASSIVGTNVTATSTVSGATVRAQQSLYAGSNLITSSDRNKKTDIDEITSAFAEEIIDGIIPKSFKYLDGDSGRTHFGMIAQDIEGLIDSLGIDSKDFSLLVKDYSEKASDDETKKNTEYGLRYEGFIAFIIKYIQCLKKKNIESENKIANLEQRIENLEALVTSITT